MKQSAGRVQSRHIDYVLEIMPLIKGAVVSLLAGSLCHAAQVHLSSLEEVPTNAVSVIVVGEIVSIKQPTGPNRGTQTQFFTSEWEITVKEVLYGTIRKKRITASLTYPSIAGVSFKTLQSGLESRMEVGKTYLLLLDSYDRARGARNPESDNVTLIRTEAVDARANVLKKWGR